MAAADTIVDTGRRATDPVLAEASASALDLGCLPGNTAKIRLLLDLAHRLEKASAPLRVLDVGAGGLFHPFNLWEPLLPLRDAVRLSGVDVAHLEQTAARAVELGFPVDLRHGGANGIVEIFGEESFDAVVSTQVLEHLPDWRGALTAMERVLRPGGSLFVTCDSGDLHRPTPDRARLVGKRAYARVAVRAPGLLRAGGPSGDWERAPTAAALRSTAEAVGLAVKAVRHYGHGGLKVAVNGIDADGRLLALALEERLPRRDPRPFHLLYLRARKPL